MPRTDCPSLTQNPKTVTMLGKRNCHPLVAGHTADRAWPIVVSHEPTQKDQESSPGPYSGGIIWGLGDGPLALNDVGFVGRQTALYGLKYQF